MAFPYVRSATGGSSSNGTTPAFSLPATINAGDLIIVFAGTDSSATLTVPSGFTEITQDNAGSFYTHIFAKVAAGTEGGTSPTGTLSGTESSCHVAFAIQDWSGNLSDVQASTIATAGSTDQADPSSVTASWGSDDNLFIAVAVADYWDQIATAWPTGYTGNQTTQQHQDQFSGTQAVSVAARELAAASDNPDAFTLATTSNQTNAAYTIVIKPAAPSGPTLSSVPATAHPGQSRTITGSGVGASQGTGGATLGGVTQTVTAWSDTSITFTTVQGGLKFQAGLTLEVTTDGSQTASDTMDLVVESGTGGYIDVVDPAVADTSSLAYQFETAVGDPVATGDQCHWRYTGISGDPTSVTVGADTLITDLDQEGDLEVRFWDATDSTWGDWATVTAEVPAVDETAPTISSASVPTSGDTIAVQMDESMQIGAGGSGGWTISLGGVSVSSAAVDGSDDTVINLTPSRTLTDEDTLTIGYTQPGDGFQDQADTPNDLATLSGQAVTNNSTQQPPDVTAPTVSSVSVPTAGSYKAGDDLEFTANASETVTVTGTPQLPINIGGTTRQADYVSGTQALLFRYTVQAGDNDGNGIGVGSAIGLNGGSIADSDTNNANLTLNSIGDTSGVLVDTVKPVITQVGGSTTTIVVGSTYTDQGATAFDDQDGSLGTVTGTGSVDTNTIGEYTITYPGAGVVDSAGNVADDATRTVRVVAEDPWPYGKGIRYAATQNWTWGKRHPKTGMRTRMYK